LNNQVSEAYAQLFVLLLDSMNEQFGLYLSYDKESVLAFIMSERAKEVSNKLIDALTNAGIHDAGQTFAFGILIGYLLGQEIVD
jgi:hypothetical protein